MHDRYDLISGLECFSTPCSGSELRAVVQNLPELNGQFFLSERFLQKMGVVVEYAVVGYDIRRVARYKQ